MRVIEYIIGEDYCGKTICDYLKHHGYSTGVITELKKSEHGIILNNNHAFTNVLLNTNDVLNICLTDDASDILPENFEFNISYEDDDILVFDKPSGVVVHPTKIYQSGTLGNYYAYLCQRRGIQCTFRPIYRIDRNTSGLVLIAKNKLASIVKVLKKYLCICHGVIDIAGTFDGSISLCVDSKIKREVNMYGQTAVTHYRRLSTNGKYSLCEITLDTGRTHQIRVHFSNAGYPLVGDTLYGYEGDSLSRHALHCSEIHFINPITGVKVDLISQLPSDMLNFMKYNNI